MRAGWAAVAVIAAALASAASWWLQRDEPPPDLTGVWQLRPDPPRPAGVRPLQRPLGQTLTIANGRIAWAESISRAYSLERLEDGALVLTIDLDGDDAPEHLPFSWLLDPDGNATFGIGELSWTGWWTRRPEPNLP